MHFLGVIGQLHPFYDSGGLILVLRFADEPGIHFSKLVGFTGNGFLEVFSGRLDHSQIAKMGMRMNGFGFCGRPEQLGDLRQLFSVGLFGKSKIFSVGLGFSGEGCGKILLCVVQVKPSLKLIDIFSMDYYYPLR